MVGLFVVNNVCAVIRLMSSLFVCLSLSFSLSLSLSLSLSFTSECTVFVRLFIHYSNEL